MEEIVGAWWDKWVRRSAYRGFPQAAVPLADVLPVAAMLFRAWGGAAAMEMKSSSQRQHGARRNWLEKLAGVGERASLAGLDNEAVYLPEQLDFLPSAELNRDAYLWLIALAAHAPAGPAVDWLAHNRAASRAALAALPGFAPRYQQLVAAYGAQRPDPAQLPADEAAQERAIRQQLAEPQSVLAWPAAKTPPQPVLLWLYPTPASLPVSLPDGEMDANAPAADASRQARDRTRRQAQRVEQPDGRDGFMLPFRAESLMSWAEYVRVNRPTDDDENSEARRAADDLDYLSVAQGGASAKSRLRFDLDLPAAAHDDSPLGEGILLPEWDWKQQALRPDYCRVTPLLATDAVACALPETLHASARQLRRRFAALAPRRLRLNRQYSGDELDLDAVIRHLSEPALQRSGDPALYSAVRDSSRSLACLLLADLSLSTDTYVNNDARVIDVIRDSLYLFAEALDAAGDAFGLYGFSSVKRQAVRFHLLKDFAERYTDAVRGRIAAIKPGFYTRMGAAIRQASAILGEQPAERKLLLLLTDGKPNDLDHYEGRYGVEDSRQAVLAARQAGLIPFCVTIDSEGGDYLPYLFGSQGYVIAQDATALPALLPRLYLQLTGQRG